MPGPGAKQQPGRDERPGPDRFDRRFDRFYGWPYWRRFWGPYPWGGMWRRDPYWMPWGGGEWGGGGMWGGDPYWGMPGGGAWGGGTWGGSPYWGMTWNGGRYRAPVHEPAREPRRDVSDIDYIWYHLVDPIVCHGLMELERGQSPEHTLRECATMGVLTGRCMCPEEAIEEVEEWERSRFRREPCPRG